MHLKIILFLYSDPCTCMTKVKSGEGTQTELYIYFGLNRAYMKIPNLPCTDNTYFGGFLWIFAICN